MNFKTIEHSIFHISDVNYHKDDVTQSFTMEIHFATILNLSTKQIDFSRVTIKNQ